MDGWEIFSLRCLIWKLPGATSGLPIFPGAACNLLGHSLGVKRGTGFLELNILQARKMKIRMCRTVVGILWNSCVEIRF